MLLLATLTSATTHESDREPTSHDATVSHCGALFGGTTAAAAAEAAAAVGSCATCLRLRFAVGSCESMFGLGLGLALPRKPDDLPVVTVLAFCNG